MKLGEFIETFIEPNCIIRLLYKDNGGHKVVRDSFDDVCMEWEVLKQRGIFRHFINNEVIGITSIYSNEYREAINITIEELLFEQQYFVKEM